MLVTKAGRSLANTLPFESVVRLHCALTPPDVMPYAHLWHASRHRHRHNNTTRKRTEHHHPQNPPLPTPRRRLRARRVERERERLLARSGLADCPPAARRQRETRPTDDPRGRRRTDCQAREAAEGEERARDRHSSSCSRDRERGFGNGRGYYRLSEFPAIPVNFRRPTTRSGLRAM